MVHAYLMNIPCCTHLLSRLKGTDWGDLDILILDLPPGTGDVQLTICQDLMLSGAVAVSTPSKLAATDTKKGIEMFTSLGVPTIAIVENMSYFVVGEGRSEASLALLQRLTLILFFLSLVRRWWKALSVW